LARLLRNSQLELEKGFEVKLRYDDLSVFNRMKIDLSAHDSKILELIRGKFRDSPSSLK
jgi:hypothetical protein